MPSSHLILCRPLLLLPPIPPSIRVFSNESTLRMRWPKYWSFSFSISPSKEIPGLISFRMDWLDLLAIQGTLKSLLQHHNSKASILQHSAFFTVQLSHLYMTTGKTIALTRTGLVNREGEKNVCHLQFISSCCLETSGLPTCYPLIMWFYLLLIILLHNYFNSFVALHHMAVIHSCLLRCKYLWAVHGFMQKTLLILHEIKMMIFKNFMQSKSIR